jgi:hypothetical protein
VTRGRAVLLISSDSFLGRPRGRGPRPPAGGAARPSRRPVAWPAEPAATVILDVTARQRDAFHIWVRRPPPGPMVLVLKPASVPPPCPATRAWWSSAARSAWSTWSPSSSIPARRPGRAGRIPDPARRRAACRRRGRPGARGACGPAGPGGRPFAFGLLGSAGHQDLLVSAPQPARLTGAERLRYGGQERTAPVSPKVILCSTTPSNRHGPADPGRRLGRQPAGAAGHRPHGRLHERGPRAGRPARPHALARTGEIPKPAPGPAGRDGRGAAEERGLLRHLDPGRADGPRHPRPRPGPADRRGRDRRRRRRVRLPEPGPRLHLRHLHAHGGPVRGRGRGRRRPATGTVEGSGLRTTRLRDVNGTLWHIPNGEIRRVGNRSQGWAGRWSTSRSPTRPTSTTPPGPSSGSPTSCTSTSSGPQAAGAPGGLGGRGARPDGIRVRLVAKTRPLEQWKVARELRAASRSPSTRPASRSPPRRPSPADRRPGPAGGLTRSRTLATAVLPAASSIVGRSLSGSWARRKQVEPWPTRCVHRWSCRW